MLNRFMGFKFERKELILLVAIILVYFVHRLFSYKLGLYMEECRDANAHLMILDGKVAYKDFSSWFYGPFAFCIYPLIFKMFGVNLVVFRLSYIIIGSLVIPLVYYLARRLMPPLWAGLSAFLSVLLINVPYYTYNHILASVAGLLALIFIVRFIERYTTSNLFLAGIFIGMSLLVKPFIMGFSILFSIFLFVLLLKFKRSYILKIKLSHIVTLSFGVLSILTPFLVYFAIQGSLYKFLTNITPLTANRASAFYVYTSFFPPLRKYWELLRTILPYKILFFPSQWKTILVQSYDRLILFSPLIFPLGIILLNKFIFHKYRLISKNAITYFLLFTTFSIFISSQSLFYLLQMGRSFTMQVPFLLITYFLFLVNNRKLYRQNNFFRYIVATLTIGFIFYLTFLHFFRYPYSRYKKYIVPLELQRAKSIKVTYPEKQLYESINKFLSENTQSDEPIAVMGYYPQFPFLCQRRNLFGDMEDIFIKLNYLSDTAKNNPVDRRRLEELERDLINRIELQRPRYILKPIIFGQENPQTRVDIYIDGRYLIEETLGPAEIDIYTLGIVKVYRLKE